MLTSNCRELIWLSRFVVIVNTIAFCIFDYEIRIQNNVSEMNRISVALEIICNIYFGVELLLNIVAYGFVMEPATYMRDPWNVLNFVSFIAG
jgi:hypothetical protein